MSRSAHSDPRPVTDILEAGAAEFFKQSLENIPYLGAWTKLYVASETLLSAMREGRVLAALAEICSNLLACEQLAIVEIERETGMVHFLSEEGLSMERREALMQSEQFLEPRIAPGSAWIPSDDGPVNLAVASLGISALVPLWREERSSGAMVLLDLLPQRRGFDTEDREVLQLLSLYAGPCLRSQLQG